MIMCTCGDGNIKVGSCTVCGNRQIINGNKADLCGVNRKINTYNTESALIIDIFLRNQSRFTIDDYRCIRSKGISAVWDQQKFELIGFCDIVECAGCFHVALGILFRPPYTVVIGIDIVAISIIHQFLRPCQMIMCTCRDGDIKVGSCVQHGNRQISNVNDGDEVVEFISLCFDDYITIRHCEGNCFRTTFGKSKTGYFRP